MSCQKIIFLDFDGVLNSVDYLKRNPAAGKDTKAIDPEALGRLDILLRATNAAVVVSSTWRLTWTLPNLQLYLFRKGLNESNVCRFIGTTPRTSTAKRGHEIQTWLKYAPPVDAFVILDDDSADMDPYRSRLIQTSSQTGLLDEHVEQAVELLNFP